MQLTGPAGADNPALVVEELSNFGLMRQLV